MEAEEKEKGGGRGDVEEIGGGGEYKLGGGRGKENENLIREGFPKLVRN